MNKKLSVLFIFMLLFQSMSGGFALASEPQGDSEGDIFTDVTIKDQEGNAISENEDSDDVTAHIEWALENTEGVEDTYTLSFPEQVLIEKEKQGDVVSDEDMALGSYTLFEDGALNISFNEDLEGHSNASGEIVVEELAWQVEEGEQKAENKAETSTETGETSEAEKNPTGNSEEDIEAVEKETSEKNATNPDEETQAKEKSNDSTDEQKTENDSVAKEDKEQTIGTFAEIEENIFTFVSMTHDGNEIEDGSIIDIGDGTEVQLEFDWDTKELDVKNGDTASMQLPDVFKQVSTPDKDLITSGVNVGTYSIQDGELEFKFNDQIEEGDVHNGEVGLNLNFNLEKFEENIEQVIDFNDSENTTLNVTARPDETASDITKEGHPDQKHNASEITWTIDVINNTDETVSNAKLNDTLPEGLGTPENLVVKALSTGLHGDKITGDSVYDFSGNITDGIEFGELKPFEGYRVEYTTPITDKDKEKFTNDASFYNGTEDLPADATVSGLTTSNPIEKSGKYNENEDQIDWTIVANENGTDIDNVVIEDDLPEGLTFDQDSFEVVKIIGDSPDENVTVDSVKFPIELGETTADEHYEINFSTDIDYGEINNGEYQANNDFTNTAILKDGDDELGDDDATVDFDREPLLEKTGTSNVDYENKTLSWKIDVNKAKHPLNDLTITDLIPKGLSIAKENIEITDEEGNDFAEKSIDINSAADDQQEVVIELGDIGTKHLTIEYTTGIEDFNVNAFNNTVSMGGDGIGKGDHETGGEVTPPGNSFYKDFKGIDYNEKTMDWQVKVDPKREAITSLTIEDTFPNKGMILDPTTVEVEHSENGTLEETEYTLKPRDEDGEEGYHKGFIIELDDDYSLNGGHLTVDYKTSYDPEFEVDGDTLDPHVKTEGKERVYENNANYSGTTENGNDFDVDKDASTKVREDSWNSGKKEGQRVHEDSEGNLENGWESGSDRKIAWQLYTNYQEQNLGSDVVITDTLDYEGSIDEDTIKVSTYEVKADGDTTITDSVLDQGAYDVNVAGDEFTLTFNEEVTERYVVEFLTTVPDISQETYTNDATVNVGDDEYPYSGTVDYRDYDDFLDKSAIGQEGSDVYIGDEINWEVQINDSLSVINEAEITDTISAGLEYVEGTLEITKADGSSLSEGTDYTLSNTKTEAGKTVFSIELHDTLKQALTLNYTTVVTAEDGDKVSNEIALDGKNFEEKTITSEELTAEEFSWVEGEFNENRGALKIVKTDSETNEAIANNPATFELYYDLNDERVQFGDQFETNEDGELLIGNLPLRTYYVQEVEAPTGYVIGETEQEINIDDPYGTDENVYEMEFTNTIEKTDVSVTKEWDDANNQDGTRPDNVDVQLLADDDPIGDDETLSEKNDWTNTWEDLDEYQSNGDKIKYTVEEVDVPKGYESTPEKDVDGNITITNTHEPETTEVFVSKEWEDKNNQDGVRPNNVTVNLLNDSEVVTEAVLDADNEWQHTFTDLPKFADGEEIQYKVTEDSVDDYSTTVETTNTDEGLDSVITNAYTPEKTTATVTKVWEDGNNQDGNRPQTVTVQLLADGEPYGDPVEVAATDNWTYVWEGLDLNSEGDPIEYTVEEKNIPEGYDVSLDNEDHGNLMITNAYEPEETDISVSKAWDDNNNQDGARPDNVTVNLLADGEIESTTVLNDEGKWKHTFTDLPVNENGEKIKYTITEDTVPEYSASIDVDPEAENGYVVTNTHTPEQTSVTATKSWEDADNQDGNRPESIELQLTADGEAVGDAVTLSDSDDWTHTWNELDLYADGDEIDYSVKELDVPEEYTVTINDEDHGNIMLNNSYTPELTEVPVTKTWDDADDQDGERPTHIKLNLLNDRGEIVKSAVVQNQDSNQWQYTFTDIPKYENGKEINYSVTEDFVSDYSTTIEEDPEVDNGFVVKNSYTPEKTSVKVTKGWNDSDNQDGNRPESIEVQLTADGDEVGEVVTLLEDDKWTHTWNELDLYADGEEINYSVKELNVPEEYTVTINDKDHGNIIITNSYTPEMTEVPITKTWKDDDNQNGDRPETITVTLLADSKIVDSVVITEANDWTYSFTNLPKYEAGGEIEYTIKEDTVEGYETTVDGFDITNLLVGETDVTGEKTWLDNDSDERPEEINVQLLANGDEVDDVDVTAESDWSYEFKDIPEYDDQGVEIDYTVEESDLKGYDEISDEAHDLTNLRIGETDVTGEKTWLDGDSEDRPDEITVNLLRDGEKVDSQNVTSEDNWEYSFTNLDKYNDQGVQYGYTIDEEPVEGYKKSADGNDLINTRTGTTEVTGEKIWHDNQDATGDRPESITVNVLQNGEIFAIEEVTAEDDWQYTFEDLPRFDENGVEWGYTVDEEDVDGYDKSAGGGNDLVNTRTGKTEVTVDKSWQDEDESDRPETITVNLLQNGTVFARQDVTKDDNWSYTFEHLPEFDDQGKAYDYTVKEHDVPGYASDVDGFDITNTRADEKTIEITKSWEDDEDSADRPDAIDVELFRSVSDGEKESVDTYSVKADGDWSLEVADLPAYDDNGKAYTYEIEEEAVAGYETEINGFDLTNTRTGKTEVTGEKTWQDGDGTDRPESITVNLLQNGEEIDSTDVTADDNWKYDFTDLEEFDEEGAAYNYTIEEENVSGYETTIDGYDITNLRVGTIDVTGTKTWQDDDASDRPDSIKVNLLQNGKVIDTADVSAEDDSTYSFTDLNQYDSEGVAYTYTVKEQDVAGYDSEVDGFDITNTRSETKSIEVTKSWQDGETENRPESITVDLLQNDEVLDTVDVTAEDDWMHKFKGLEAYDDNGVAYEYSIQEQDVEGYTTEINGFDITNTLEESATELGDPDDPNNGGTDPEEPGDSDDAGDSQQSGTSDDTDDAQSNEIPKTATNMFNLLALGALFTIIGLGLTVFRKVRSSRDTK